MADDPMRFMLNPYWCALHWMPYAKLPEVIQKRVNVYVPEHLWTLPEFKRQVIAKRREYGEVKNLAKLVVIDWTQAHNKSMCCILGDSVMDSIRRRLVREFDLPL